MISVWASFVPITVTGAQMIAPYVDEEIAWAIEKHQALRFFRMSQWVMNTLKPTFFFGADYQPEPYLIKEWEEAKKHRWYMTSRLITLNDLYSFEEG